MLGDYDAMATLGVSDLQRARDFYSGVLRFGESDEQPPDGVVFRCGSTQLFLYPSSYAGTNRATALSVQVPTEVFDDEVKALRDRGVTFQTYEMEGVDWDDGVARYGDMYRAVWFEDPDRNIINIAAALSEG